MIVNAATKANTIVDNVIRGQQRNSVNSQSSNKSQWTGIKLNAESLENLLDICYRKLMEVTET